MGLCVVPVNHVDHVTGVLTCRDIRSVKPENFVDVCPRLFDRNLRVSKEEHFRSVKCVKHPRFSGARIQITVKSQHCLISSKSIHVIQRRTHSRHKCINVGTVQSINQSIDRSIDQSIDRSINQSINQWFISCHL